MSRLMCILALFTFAFAVRADTVEDFYRGRQITIFVGYGTGGAYDLYARLLSRHMGKYIPGQPNILVQNMPGAGSMRAANFLYSVAPRDGTAFGIFARPMALLAALGTNSAVQFDPRRYTWIGSASNYQEDAYLFFVRPDSPIKTVHELLAKDRVPLVVGGTAQGASGNDVPILLQDVLGLNIKLVPGYQDANELYLAVDRKEVDARATDLSGVRSGHPEWLNKNTGMRVLLQFGRATRHPDYPDVPTARELARDATERAIIETAEMPYLMSRPFAAPPGVPADRAEALRTAFIKTLADPDVISEAQQMGLGITPVSGAEVSALVERLYTTRPEVLDYLRKLMKHPG